MATAYVSMGKAGIAGGIPVFAGNVKSESVTTSGTAASGLLIAPTDDTVAKINCATAVYATGNGTASASNGLRCEAGESNYVGVPKGGTVSIIDA